MKPIKRVVRRVVGDANYREFAKRKNNAKAFWSYIVIRYLQRRKYMGYDASYYQETDLMYSHSFSVMAAGLVELYNPSRVIDVGCGSGAFGQALLNCGVREVYGFDQSQDAVTLAREHGLTGAEVLDITVADKLPVSSDLCTSFEVAEHLPGIYAQKYCGLLAAAAPNVVITAAHPGQGGHLHVNEQPAEYWIHLMGLCGHDFDAKATNFLKAAWRERVATHYHGNLLAFRRV